MELAFHIFVNGHILMAIYYKKSSVKTIYSARPNYYKTDAEILTTFITLFSTNPI